MICAGILDPAKVTRTAPQNAASIAGLTDKRIIPSASQISVL